MDHNHLGRVLKQQASDSAAIFVAMLLAHAQARAAEFNYLPIKGSAFHICPADVEGDGANEVVYAAFDGAVRCIDPATSGAPLWEAPIGGFPFDLTTYDIDGDGRAESFAACADGKLYTIDHDGSRLWTYDTGYVCYAAGVGRAASGDLVIACGGMDATFTILSSSGQKLDAYTGTGANRIQTCLSRIGVCDMDNDGVDEFRIRDGRGSGNRAFMFRVDAANKIVFVWRRYYRMDNSTTINTADFDGYCHAFGDVNGDGLPEMLHGGSFGEAGLLMQNVTITNMAGDYLAHTKPLNFFTNYDTQYDYFSTAFVAVANLTDDPGDEFLSAAGGTLQVYSLEPAYYDAARNRYNPVQRYESRLAFTDIAIDGSTLYLGSTPNGDQTIYRINLNDPDWSDQYVALERRGLQRQIGETLANLHQQLEDYSGAAPDRGQYVWRLAQLGTTWGNNTYRYYQTWMETYFPFTYAGGGWLFPQEGMIHQGFGQWYTHDQIEQEVAGLEAEGLPFVLGVAHHTPNTDMSAAELLATVYAASSNTLRGFTCSEDGDGMVAGENMFVTFHKPILDFCVEHGMHEVFDEKGAWWMNFPSQQTYYDALFGGGRNRAVVATGEDSNSRTPELNLMARFGLRQAGLVDNIECTAINDDFCANRFFEWETPRHGHPFFRKLVVTTLLGGNSAYPRYGPFYQSGGTKSNLIGRESFDLWMMLIGKGLIFQPKPSEMAGTCPVGLAMHAPPEYWMTDAENGHGGKSNWMAMPEMREAVFPYNGVVWGYAPTPEHALQRVLFNKTMQFGTHVPATPFGPVAIVPAIADLSAVEGVEEWWHTDGVYLWREGGEKMQGMAAANALRAACEAAAVKLPFRASGDDVFFQVVRQQETGVYHLYAVDPGWIDPSDRAVTVTIQLPGEYVVRDALTTTQTLEVTPEKTFSFVVPAGSLRILKAEAVHPCEIEVDAVAVSVPEGGSASFRIRLSAPPDGARTVSVVRRLGDADIEITGGSALVFDAGNFDQYQTVSLRALLDADTLDSSATLRCSAPGMANVDVTATEGDSGPNGIIVSARRVLVPEAGASSFTVALASPPAADVCIAVARFSGDRNIYIHDGADLLFSAGDASSKTVELRASDDGDTLDGEAVIRCSSDGMASADVTAVEADNARRLLFDFGSATNQTNLPSPVWNNVTSYTAGTPIANAVDSKGTATGIALDIAQRFTSNQEGLAAPVDPIYPASAVEDALTVATPYLAAAVRLRNLPLQYAYDLTFYGGHRSSLRMTDYAVGVTTVSLFNTDNERETVSIRGVRPQPDGSVLISIAMHEGAARGHLGVMEVRYDTETPPSQTTVFHETWESATPQVLEDSGPGSFTADMGTWTYGASGMLGEVQVRDAPAPLNSRALALTMDGVDMVFTRDFNVGFAQAVTVSGATTVRLRARFVFSETGIKDPRVARFTAMDALGANGCGIAMNANTATGAPLTAWLRAGGSDHAVAIGSPANPVVANTLYEATVTFQKHGADTAVTYELKEGSAIKTPSNVFSNSTMLSGTAWPDGASLNAATVTFTRHALCDIDDLLITADDFSVPVTLSGFMICAY